MPFFLVNTDPAAPIRIFGNDDPIPGHGVGWHRNARRSLRNMLSAVLDGPRRQDGSNQTDAEEERNAYYSTL